MPHFFITGLPRSRTCWLANLLTNKDSFCLHAGLLRNGGDLGRLAGNMAELATRYIDVGDADPSLLPAPNFERVNEIFPGARWVFIDRDPGEACTAHNEAFPEMSLPLDVFEELSHRMQMLSRDMIAFHYHVPFKRLNEPAICAALHRFCTGRDMDYNRWEQLARMRVTADKETWLARMDVSTRGKIAEVLA